MNTIRKKLVLILPLSLMLSPVLGATQLVQQEQGTPARRQQKKVGVLPAHSQNDQLVEEVIIGQLYEFAKPYKNQTLPSQSVQEKKALIEQLPQETKEKILKDLVIRMKDKELEHPFTVPQGTDYSQMDTFFLLVKSLMNHDQELEKKLNNCIGEKQLPKLGKKLSECPLPQSVRDLVTLTQMLKLVKLIQKRMETKAQLECA